VFLPFLTFRPVQALDVCGDRTTARHSLDGFRDPERTCSSAKVFEHAGPVRAGPRNSLSPKMSPAPKTMSFRSRPSGEEVLEPGRAPLSFPALAETGWFPSASANRNREVPAPCGWPSRRRWSRGASLRRGRDQPTPPSLALAPVAIVEWWKSRPRPTIIMRKCACFLANARRREKSREPLPLTMAGIRMGERGRCRSQSTRRAELDRHSSPLSRALKSGNATIARPSDFTPHAERAQPCLARLPAGWCLADHPHRTALAPLTLDDGPAIERRHCARLGSRPNPRDERCRARRNRAFFPPNLPPAPCASSAAASSVRPADGDSGVTARLSPSPARRRKCSRSERLPPASPPSMALSRRPASG